MTERLMMKASLDDLRAMDERDELSVNPHAPESDELPEGFWDDAVLVAPRSLSVHLRLDPDVFQHFKSISGGKGHITLMQNVLRAYVEAHKKGRVPPYDTK